MASWKGALDYRGFPVNVAFHAQKKSTRGAGFRIVGPDGQPPVNKSYEASSGRELTSDDMGKAVSIGKGKAAVLHPLSAEAIETITGAEKTRVMEAGSYAPVSSVPLELALKAFVVTPDLEVAGSERSATLLWNGLRKTGLAFIAQVTIDSRDSVVAIWATETEMKAVTLPFVQEMYPKPSYEWEVNEQMADVFASDVEENYEIKPLELGDFASEYEATRNGVIDQVLAGGTIAAPVQPKPKADVPDLMEMLQGMAAKKPAKKAPAKTKKVAA